MTAGATDRTPISRSQIWQWILTGTELSSGEVVTAELVASIVAGETARLLDEVRGDPRRAARVTRARELFDRVALGSDYPTFLTVPAYATYV